jgi:very-short-patch-repair endonuclease
LGQWDKNYAYIAPFVKGSWGIYKLLKYSHVLKSKARTLRENMTDSERALWSRLRGKQIMGVQFYRQKPIGNYIVDFYCPKARLIIEADGSQHLDQMNFELDKQRDMYMQENDLKVLRFDNLQVLKELDSVMEMIYRTVEEQLKI